jgi:hypothetical protein
VSRWSRRLARIKQKLGEGVAGYRLPDGRVQYIRSKNVYAAFMEAMEGTDTPRARLMLAAVDCVTPGSGGRLHEFAQAMQDGPTVKHQPTQKEQTQ